MTHADPGKDFSSNDYYRALFDNPKKNCVLLLDEDGIILETNRAFLLSFGYDTEDLTGKHFSMLFTEEDREKDLPTREVNTVLTERQSYDNNYLVNKSGVRTWASGESVLFTNAQGQQYILKIIQNIHVQKESEQSIVRLNTFNESILRSVEDAVLVLDEDFRIIKANRSFIRLFDLGDTPLDQVDFHKLLRSFDHQGEVYAAVASIFGTHQTPGGSFQLEFVDVSGQKRCFEVSCLRLDHAAQDHALLIFHDITTHKNQERQREDIINFVAHELRNPLTNIMLNIGWMQGQLKEQQFDDFGDTIDRTRRNVERLKKLVNELYNSTKLISGNYDLQNESFDLDGLIDECLESTRLAHPGFTIQRKGRADLSLSADRDKLLQVLGNYLSNALKYSDGHKDVLVTVRVQDGWVTVAVADHGKGIPAKELPYIFNRFYRAEKTKNLEGLGIGLFLSRQIIEAHKGKTWVESEEGKGSTFYFSLPVSGH